MRRRYRSPYRNFSRPTRDVISISTVTQRKKKKCATCGDEMPPGTDLYRIRTRKAYRTPCSTCGQKPARVKYFHNTLACQPLDPYVAMHVDRTGAAQQAAPAPDPHRSHGAGNAVPPPPKPPTLEEVNLEALVKLEAAVIFKAQRKGITPELEKAFKTFQGLKARVLRPGTEAEGEVAVKVALKRVIDLVY